MALIKCSECGKSVSDKAKSCPSCGNPIEKKLTCSECGEIINKNDDVCKKCGCPVGKKNLKISKNPNIKIIIGGICGVVVLIIILCIVFGKGDTLYCTTKKSSTAGAFEFKVTYTFKDGEIKSLKGYSYAKPSDISVAESLWNISNKQQDQYNYYDGLSYKATYSEDHEVVLNYSIDAQKAPKMFESVATLSGVDGITASSTKDEVRTIFEDNGFKCK